MRDFKQQRAIACILASVYAIATGGCEAEETNISAPSKKEINASAIDDNPRRVDINSNLSESRSIHSFLHDQWQVNQVLFDRSGKSSTQGINESINIPKYLGRLVTITPDTFSINTHNDPTCKDPTFIQEKNSVAKLIAQSISLSVDSSKTLPQDIDFPIAPETAIDVLYLTCQGALQAKDRGMEALADKSNATWLVALPNDQIALSWHEQAVLVLNRVPENATPSASFDCAKAGTTVEKTLCSDIGLAAYDKSLATTYREAKAYYQLKPDATDSINELKNAQREWIIQRDRCGSDVDCLEKAIGIRIGDIIYDVNEYAYRHR